MKVLGADGSGHISDLIEGIDWVIANRQRYQINVINLLARRARRSSRGATTRCARPSSVRGR